MYRRKLTARQRAALQYKQQAPIGIGATRREEQEVADRHENAVIKAVHDFVFWTRPACQLCGGRRQNECRGRRDHMHEDPSRAMTRGRPAEERFNARVCGRVCAACHADVTEHRVRVVFEDAVKRFMGRCWTVPVGGDDAGNDC